MKFTIIASASREAPKESSPGGDGLPLRESGSYIEKKHRCLVYYAEIFNQAMKGQWSERIYVEYFAGPGRCLIRETGKEELGSPLRVLEANFTKFIFMEMSLPLAEALRDRLKDHPKEDRVEIWVGDCNEALDQIQLPSTALSLAFIDPTRIGHCPFELIAKTRRKSPRVDLLLNIPVGMDIKRNMHNYIKQQGASALLTRYLGSEKWKAFPDHKPGPFCRALIEEYERQLNQLNWGHVGRMQPISTLDNHFLYYLFFGSAHATGKKFWNDTVKYCNDRELDLFPDS